MHLISCHNGRLLASALAEEALSRPKVFTTGLRAVDELLPHGGFARGAVHEVLSHPRHGSARLFALLLARAAATAANASSPLTVSQTEALPIAKPQATNAGAGQSDATHQVGVIIWCDPRAQLYPPAVAAMGIALDRFYVLHPRTVADQIWAITECLRCRGVGATVAPIERLSRIEARRLQLAAERGGGAGILLRPLDRHASTYAAATRWLVAPMPGERTVQRWNVQLIHGHGGRVGQTVILEHHRETRTLHAREAARHAARQADPVHSTAQLADRPPAATARARARATA